MDGTKVYGASDDLIEFEGDLFGEVGGGEADDEGKGTLCAFSDGTLLEVKYGKDDKGIWEVRVVEKGALFDHIDPCTDDEADVYSDVAYFKPGLRWAYVAAAPWSRVD